MKFDYKKKWMIIILTGLLIATSIPTVTSINENSDDSIDYESSRKHVVSLSGRCQTASWDTFSLHFIYFYLLLPLQSITFVIVDDLDFEVDGEQMELECPVFIGLVGFKGFAPCWLWYEINMKSGLPPLVRVFGICDSLRIIPHNSN